MQKYNGFIQRQFDSQQFGNPDSGQTVTVRDSLSGDKAILYVDNGVNPLSNPLVADSKGRFSFYTENGRYDIEFGSPVIDELTIKDIIIFDNVDFSGVEDAPQDSKKYGRIDSTWEEVQDFIDAPIDGELYGRKDGGWESISSVTYPSKVGDTYVSNSGPIIVDDHLLLDGSEYFESDYPLLAGTPGYNVLSGPIGFTGTLSFGSSSESNLSDDADTWLSKDKSLLFQTSQITLGNRLRPSYSIDGGLNWLDGVGVSSSFGDESVDCIAYKDQTFIINDGISMYLYNPLTGFVDSSSYSGIKYGLGINQSSALSETGVLVGRSPDNSSDLRYSLPNDFTSFTDISIYSVTNNTQGALAYITFFKGYFYMSLFSNDGGSLFRTSDFTVFEEIGSSIAFQSIGGIFSSETALYVWDNSSNIFYRSTDGVLLNISNSSQSDRITYVRGTSDVLFRVSNNSVKRDISFDGGSTFINPPVNSNSDSVVISYSEISESFVMGSGSDSSLLYQAELPSNPVFSVPLLNELTIGHKYYVKGR